MAKKNRFRVVDTETGKSVCILAFLASLSEILNEDLLPEKSQIPIPNFLKQMVVKSSSEREN